LLIALVIIIGSSLALAESQPAAKNYETSLTLRARVAAIKPIRTAISSEAKISHVVVKFADQHGARIRSGQFEKVNGSPLPQAAPLLTAYVAQQRCRRLFQATSEGRLDKDRQELQSRSGQQLADLNNYYRIDVSDRAEAEALINNLNALESVEVAYFQPLPEVAEDVDPPTPDYEPNQDYREAAPAGVDAVYANTLVGGDGAGVKIIDIENDWVTTHEDLESSLGGVIGSYPGGGSSSNHGTAVIGEMIAGDNGYGVTGICPGAEIGMISVTSMSTASAIYTAVENLEAGDFVLIELHAPGPRYDFQSRPDQLGYVCMEYWQANFDAMLYAWARGVIIMEPAGNGAEDFDDIIYGDLFDTTYRNSHAIVIGAGYPAAADDDLERLGFSNHGERVNLQGYGSGVYTTGYGYLFDGDGDKDQYYTSSFGGTSSASPIVTGAAACLQGHYEATYGISLTADAIRSLLAATGTQQLGDTTEHIGPRPDLLAAIAVMPPPSLLYATPMLIDTAFSADEVGTVDLWLHNRSLTETLDFTIADEDSTSGKAADWLSAMPASGVIGIDDSALIEVSLDGTVLETTLGGYRGLLLVSWGVTGMALDSLTKVPVLLGIPCNDTTYRAVSSEEPDGPSYQWISARTLGSRIDPDDFYGGSAPLDDGSAGPTNIGFKFPFYDTTYNRMFVGVNGAISFTDTNVNVNSYFGGIDIPGAPFETVIAAFWNDLIFDPGDVPDGGIYLYNDPSYDTLVIEWYHPGSFNDPGDTTTNFEILLTLDGSIVFQYANIGVSGMEQTATIGIGEFDCRGVGYAGGASGSGNEVSAGEAVRFYFTDREWIRSGNIDDSPTANIDIVDLIYLVTYMFQGGPEPIPMESGNVNCSSGNIDIVDLIYLVTYMFQGGPEPCYFLRQL
jgi:hypothetical protein